MQDGTIEPLPVRCVPSFSICSRHFKAITTFPASIATARDHVRHGVFSCLAGHVGSKGAKVMDRGQKLQQDGAVPQFSGNNRGELGDFLWLVGG